MKKVKVKCPVCGHTMEVLASNVAPTCPKCFMQMIAIRAEAKE